MPRLSRKKEKSKIIKKKNTKKRTTKKKLKGGGGLSNIIEPPDPLYKNNTNYYLDICADLDGYKLNITNIESTDTTTINKLIGIAKFSNLDYDKIQQLLKDSEVLKNYKLLNNLQKKIDDLESTCFGFNATNNPTANPYNA